MLKELNSTKSKNRFFIVTLVMACGFCFFNSFSILAQKSPVDYVNVFTGTSNSRWMLGPYACVPFGMVQPGPDNQGEVWMGGYEYAINSITAFSHLHAWTMAGLAIMPSTQDLTTRDNPTDAAYRGAGATYHSRIDKRTEKASPGYYSVFLYDVDAKAELTATTHCAFHQYTFEKQKKDARILIDLAIPAEYKCDLKDGKIQRISNNIIEGYATSHSYYNDYTLYFTIQFSKSFKSFNGWSNSTGIQKDIEQIADSLDLGAFVNFDVEQNEQIQLKVGLSLVDIEGARRNLENELDPFDWNFDAVAEKAHEDWNNLLSKIEVKGGTESDKEKFYTNLYRCYSQKQTWSDVDGRYRDPMERIQQLTDGEVMYGGDAFWNTFWNLNTLWSIVNTDIMNNWVRTEIELFDKTGWTNNGPTGLEHTGIMEVTHEVALMTSAYMKGIRNYDSDKLFKAIRNTATVQGAKQPKSGLAGMDNLNIYNELGFVPYTVSRTDRTLNYAYTDYCFAQLARAFGQIDDYNFHLKRSANWKNLFHPELKFMVPRNSKGEWLTDFHPLSGFSFTEGNSWQYSWYVPHDIPGLINMTGKDLFNKRLEEGFEKSVQHSFAAHAFDRRQNVPYEYYINHGNEANMQAAFLFNYSGKPWLTQKYSRAILDLFYGNTPYHGWEGDEDEGQMGGWFIIASMGLFEMNGGVTENPVFDLTSPLFDEIIIHVDKMYNGGKPFVIKTINNSKENVFIQSAMLNGNILKVPKLAFNDLVKGGELVFIMGNKPNTNWGIQ